MQFTFQQMQLPGVAETVEFEAVHVRCRALEPQTTRPQALARRAQLDQSNLPDGFIRRKGNVLIPFPPKDCDRLGCVNPAGTEQSKRTLPINRIAPSRMVRPAFKKIRCAQIGVT
jgi:hypothetical protein